MNILFEKLNRLNGWQRLFAAFLVFIYTPLTFMLINAQANVPEPSRDTVVSILQKADVPKIPNGEINWAKDVWENAPPAGRQSFRLDYGYGWRFDVTMPDSVPADEAKKMVAKVDSAFGSYYRKELWIDRLTIAFYCFIVAVLMYFFGWTLGWIYKGFRKS